MHKWCKVDKNLYSPVQSSTAAYTEDKTLLVRSFVLLQQNKETKAAKLL